MGSSKLVGVVTVTFNSRGVIDDFMKSILKQTCGNFILYVVDNASSDETLNRLAEYNDTRIVSIANQENVGVAEGNNIGIQAALKEGCELVLLINNDTVFDLDLFEKLVKGLEENGCDMVVPKILFFDRPDTIWCAGGYFSVIRGAPAHCGLGHRADDHRFNQTRMVSHSPTCCMLIKREVFDRVGLMDPNYFAYFDDSDFCWRAHRAGAKLFYLHDAKMLHKVGSLSKAVSDFNVRFHTRNHVYFVLKNITRWQALSYLIAYPPYLIFKYVFLARSPRSYRVAQKAFWEGVSLFNSVLDGSLRKIPGTG